MKFPEALRAFRAAVTAGSLAERYDWTTITITCSACGARWERERYDPRRVTLVDRRTAVEHLATCVRRRP